MQTMQPRLLFYIENRLHTRVDGREDTVCRTLDFVSVCDDGRVCKAGFAPYLDLDVPTQEEKMAAQTYIDASPWLSSDLKTKAMEFANAHFLTPIKKRVKSRQNDYLEKIRKETETRLWRAISYWDSMANAREAKKLEGQNMPQVNIDEARNRAGELRARLKARQAEIDGQRTVYAVPPMIKGCILFMPQCVLWECMGASSSRPDVESKKAIERVGMDRVMALERGFGNTPRDVSEENCGYDICSRMGIQELSSAESLLRFIEVKARRADADGVTLTRNEIQTARNVRKQYVLAVVRVDGDTTHTTYYGDLRFNPPDVGMSSVHYDIARLSQMGRILYED